MADGTVRGTFDLRVDPALRAVREYRTEAKRADDQTQQLGRTMDEVFGPTAVATIRTAREEMGGLGTTARDTRMQVRDEWQGMRREVQRESAAIVSAIAVVRDRMRDLGRMHVTPTIDLGGVAEALTQVELLQQRISSLSRQRATPTVAVGGGFGSAAQRAASGARTTVGGGGGGGFSTRGGGVLDFGRAGLQPRNLLMGVGALYAQPLAGAAVGLAGSASGAALGAGAAGAAGLGVLGAGAIGVVSVMKPAMSALKDAMKAQEAYTKAVREHGRRSEQAKSAAEALNRAEANRPGIGRAGQQIRGFQREWLQYTRPAQQQVYGGIADVTAVGRRAAPQLAANAAVATTAVRGAAVDQARFLANPRQMSDLAFFTHTFARELPTAERTLENVERTFANIARAATPFFHDANVWVEQQTSGWRRSTSNIDETRRRMRPLVEEAKDWRDLTIATFHTIRDLFNLGRPAGDSMVVDLTRTMDRWDAWIQANPARVQSFFTDSARSVERMADALAKVAHWLNSMATLLRPIADRLSDAVGLAAQLGLIGTPGAGAALLGAYRGVRGRGGAATGAAGGAGAMLVPGGAAAGGAGLGAGATLAAGGAGYLAARGRGRLGLSGYGAVATPEAFAQRYGGVEGARYAMPVSQLGARSTMAGRLASRGGAAARGAARSAAPLVAAIAALDFATTPGTVGERAQQAVSGVSFGLIPGATTGAMARQQGQDAAARNVAGLGPATTIADIQAQIAQVSGMQSRAGRRAAQRGPSFLGIGLHGALVGGPQDAARRRAATEAGTYTNVLKDLNRQEDELRKTRKRQLDDLSEQRGTAFGARLPAAYRAFRRGGMSQQEAFGSTVDQVQGRLGRTRSARGAEALGESALGWANAMAKESPKLKGQVRELTESIEKRFERMGKRVQIVNGDILTGSKSEWSRISTAMSDPVEQAREKLSADFTAIQKKAIGSLRAFGFGPKEAAGIVAGRDPNATHEQRAASRAAQEAGPGTYESGIAAGTRAGPARRATGGIVPGRGLSDTVQMGGAMVAPGEAWIANRHTLADLSRATVRMYGKTAQQMITSESRRHADRPQAPAGIAPRSGIMPGLQRGGRGLGQGLDPARTTPGLTGRAGVGGGAGGGGVDAVLSTMNSIDAQHYPYKWGGGHDAGFSPPYDCSGAVSTVLHAGGYLNSPLTSGALMSFGEPGPGAITIFANPHHTFMTVGGRGWGTGTSNPGGGAGWLPYASRPGFTVRHVGGATGGGAVGLAGGGVGSMAAAAPQITVTGVGRQQRGIAGVLRQRAGDLYAAGLQQSVNQRLGAAVPGVGAVGATGAGGDARQLGHQMMLAGGWPESEWGALDRLWTRESNWNANAVNRSSGAMGIPQALGHGNVFALGNPGPQIAWGLNYIRGRYGSPSAAWAHEQSHNWYARGGRMRWAGAFAKGGSFTTNGPTAFVAGEGGRRERVAVTPLDRGGGHGQTHVTFEKGSIVVGSSDEAAEKVARKIIEAIDKPRGKVG